MFESIGNFYQQSLELFKTIDARIPAESYIALPMLVGAAMTVQGLSAWNEAGTKLSLNKAGKVVRVGGIRPVVKTLWSAAVTHGAGVALFYGLVELVQIQGALPVESFFRPDEDEANVLETAQPWVPVTLFIFVLFLPLVLSLLLVPENATPSESDLSLSSHIHSLNLILAGLAIAVAPTLHIEGSIILSLLICIPVYFAKVGGRSQLKQFILAGLSPTTIWALWWVVEKDNAELWVKQVVRDWPLTGSAGGWFVCAGITPLLMQAALVGLCSAA